MVSNELTGVPTLPASKAIAESIKEHRCRQTSLDAA
jgi:hypothetical protein